MPSKKENLNINERISKLEQDIISLRQEMIDLIRSVYAANYSLAVNYITKRDCDGNTIVKANGEEICLIGNKFGIMLNNPVFHAVDDTLTSRKCSFGYDETENSFRVELADSSGEHLGMEVKTDGFTCEGMRANSISSYDNLVIDENGNVGIPASDREMKEDIRELSFTLDDFVKVKPITFKWKNKEKKVIGFLNDELNKVYHIKVHEIISLIAILWKAVLDLHDKIEKV